MIKSRDCVVCAYARKTARLPARKGRCSGASPARNFNLTMRLYGSQMPVLGQHDP
jgi:hypothetical protein